MIGGAVLVAFSGMAAASMWSNLSNRVDVLAATDLIDEGQIITAEDLKEVSISADAGVRAISPTQRDELVGQVATGPIGAGSIIHPAQFIADDAEGQPQVIVGLALEPGQYPRAGLRPGDAIQIIETTGPNRLDEEADTGPRVIAVGEVAEVRQLSQSDALLISLRVDEAASAKISELGAQERISLALIDAIAELIEPADPARPLEPGAPLDAGDQGQTAPASEAVTPTSTAAVPPVAPAPEQAVPATTAPIAAAPAAEEVAP